MPSQVDQHISLVASLNARARIKSISARLIISPPTTRINRETSLPLVRFY
ncbi:hypothetical protein DSUL_20186 [Desulfovibrionales bacterium]